jgi:hypothetical protein
MISVSNIDEPYYVQPGPMPCFEDECCHDKFELSAMLFTNWYADLRVAIIHNLELEGYYCVDAERQIWQRAIH